MSALAAKRRASALGTMQPMPTISTIESPLQSSSVTNKPAHGASLYHTCRTLLSKLAAVEGMEKFLHVDAMPSPLGILATSPTSPSSEPSTPPMHDGPLTKLWTMCRWGSPLCHLFNALKTEKTLQVDDNPNLSHVNACKASVYHFIVACRDQLCFTEDDLFTISDLYQNDTNGFVKVVNTIDKIIQLLEEKGIIAVRSSKRDSDPDMPKDTRDKVVLELLETERKYVQDLEVLQNYMRDLQTQQILSPDTIHYLFGNLNFLLDFQRKFLIQLEDTAEKPPEKQRFCHLFCQNEEAFAVYEPYCANYYSAQDLVVQETPKLQKLADVLNPEYELPSMLIKPVQRICKYPLLLSQLIKTTNKDWPYYAEMEEGLEAIKRVAEKVNETQRKHENMRVVEDLKKRVDDPKARDICKFGDLLLHDKLILLNGDSTRKVYMFLFEKMLLICTESKDTNKNRLTKSNTLSMKKSRRGDLQIKGRILTERIVGVHNKSQPGQWVLQVEYKDREVEQFKIKFWNEEQLKLWETTMSKFKVTKSHVPNTHLLSMAKPTYTGQPRYILNDDSSASENDDDKSDSEEHGKDETVRSAAKSITSPSLPHGRPKMIRKDSQDTPWPSNHGRGIYPLSPPASHPSSPAMSSPPANGSPAMFSRNGQITPTSDEYTMLMRPPPVERSQSQTAADLSSTSSSGHPFLTSILPSSLAQNRVRSQSSPNIRKQSNGHWDCKPQPPPHTWTAVPKADIGNTAVNVLDIIPDKIKVKLCYNDGVYAIAVAQDVCFPDLMKCVEKKIRLVGNLKPTERLRIKYQDEDGDFITINSDEDVQMAFEAHSGKPSVQLFVHL